VTAESRPINLAKTMNVSHSGTVPEAERALRTDRSPQKTMFVVIYLRCINSRGIKCQRRNRRKVSGGGEEVKGHI
jgi:hypothetical protein